MNPTRLLTSAAFMVIAVATSIALQRHARGRPRPARAADSPVLSPAEELKTFYMPPGYHLELVASEPLDSGPGRDRLGQRGPPVGRRDARLHARHPGRAANTNPLGRVVVLEDTNDDGRMDKRTVFADGPGAAARALKVLDHGVLVGEPPNLWLMQDTNGDLKADTKELVTDTLRPARGATSSTTPTPAVGARQLDLHLGGRHVPAPARTASSRCGRRSRAASGARPRTTSGASSGTPTNRRSMSTSCRRPTSCATRR